ncbi:MAG TPA: DNA gyrase subunit A [Firmicutes bacterium]|nr:DNA gyrase subunit A [Candidatus Fermentithermobacillaceae bacterium]
MATNAGIVETFIEEEMKRSYIDYSMSVIVSRALPDVRDGLKPVQRRILYAMYEQGMRHDRPHKKSARLVGEVLGKYHPHGDMAVYDALVRMAQDFNMRYPLVDGHGNFGSVDGDAAAAMRYTEVRMAKIAGELLADIEKETVDFGPNFDDTLKEPVVLPARIPNLLINGSSGIAVGMATNIPPHNLGEVVDALVALIDDPQAENEKLMEYIKGPDFPTGGLITGRDRLRTLYTTGRSIITVRAKTRIERQKQRNVIIVDELPYQVNKANLVEQIALLVRDKKIQGVSDLRDESDKTGLRVVVEVRKDTDPEVVLRQLFKHTALQQSFGAIMLALVHGKPVVLDLKGMLGHYLEHRKEVVIRRTTHDLKKAEERAHVLAGLEIALANLDEVIALIRASASPEEARKGLVERFGLDEIQANAILDTKLERLTRLERDKIIQERRALLKDIEYYRAVLASEKMIFGIIRKELLEIKEAYGDKRRTQIVDEVEEISDEDLIIEEDVVVLLTNANYVKRMPLGVYRNQRRGGTGSTAMDTRESDFIERVVITTTKKSLLVFSDAGKAYWLRVYDIPEAGRHAKGYPVSKLLPLAETERLTALIPIDSESKGDLFFVTKYGVVKRTPVDAFLGARRNGVAAINLKENDQLVLARLVEPGDEIVIGTHDGKALRLTVDSVRIMGRTAAGVKGIRLEEGDYVIGADPISSGSLVLTVTERGYGKCTPAEEFPLRNRGALGVKAARLTESGGKLAALRVVRTGDEAVLATAQGTVIRLAISQVKQLHRDTAGVRLMKVDPEDRVSAVAILEAS